MTIDAILLSRQDNVATAVQDLRQGQLASVKFGQALQRIAIIEDIPYGHKFAVLPVTKGDPVFKYGEVMGRATRDIGVGCHAHVHNIESLRGRGDLREDGQ